MDGLNTESGIGLLQSPPTTSELPPALVVGSGITLLGVVRILGRRGLPLGASVRPQDLARFSRWLPHRARLPGTDGTVPLAEYLERLPVEEGFLIPCSDELALEAAELPCELTARFRSYQPEARVLRLLVDKGAFLQALDAAGVPHPRTYLVERVDDLRAISDADLAASFIKPRCSQRFHREHGVKGFRPGARADFRALLHDLLEEGHGLMIQQYVPGPASNHYFVDGFATEGGEIAALFARRRLRMYPLDFGNSSFMVSIPLDDVRGAIDSLRRLLHHLHYRGIFSAEFKRDASDGEFRILEINARPWWYVEFAARAGVDVVTLAYRAAYGLPLDPPTGYQVGRTLAYPYYDWHACRSVTRGTLGGTAAIPRRRRGRRPAGVHVGRSFAGPAGVGTLHARGGGTTRFPAAPASAGRHPLTRDGWRRPTTAACCRSPAMRIGAPSCGNRPTAASTRLRPTSRP